MYGAGAPGSESVKTRRVARPETRRLRANLLQFLEISMNTAEVAKAIAAAVKNVLSTMAGMTPKLGKPFIKKDDNPALGEFSAVIGVTGAYKGSICVTFDRSGAECVVRAMLGDAVENLEQDAVDTVGEIANMISGQARASLAEGGVMLQGSTPTIVTGKEHRIIHLSKAPVHCIPFAVPEGGFVVEFCME
jgi:chemotaxis protein CheX